MSLSPPLPLWGPENLDPVPALAVGSLQAGELLRGEKHILPHHQRGRLAAQGAQAGCSGSPGLPVKAPTLKKLLGELSTASAGPCPEMEGGGFGSRADTCTGCSTVTTPVSSAPLVPWAA